MEREQMNRVEDMLGQLIKMVGEGNRRLITLEEKCDKYDEWFHKMNERFDKADERFDKMDYKIDSLQVDITHIDKHVQTLTAKHVDHDHMFDMLMRKSFESDWETKEMKNQISALGA